jgi:PAS domain S-box-containing protein
MNDPISQSRSEGRQTTSRLAQYFSRFEGKLVWLFLLLSLGPLILASSIAIHSATQALERNIEAQLELRAQYLIDSVDNFLALGHSAMQTWAGSPVMLDVVADDPDGRVSRMLIALEGERSTMGPLSVVNGAGIIVAASESSRIGNTVAAEPWFREVVQRFGAGQSSESFDLQPVDDGFRMTIPLKVEIKGLPRLGYLSTHLTQGRLAAFVRSVEVARDSATDLYLVRDLHEVIVSLETLDHPPEGSARLQDLVSFFEKNRPTLHDSRSSGGAVVALPDGESVLVGFAHSRRYPSMGWRAITAQQSASALQPVQSLRLQTWELGGLISILVVGLAMLIARIVSRPIRAITRNAELVAAGELVISGLPVWRRDEIGSLATAFQVMTEKLRAFTQDLERQVQARTAELEKSNASLRDSEERCRLLIAQVQDYSIILLDSEGRVLTWNEGAQRLKGYRAEDILYQSIACVYTGEDRASGLPERLLETARNSGRVTDEGWRVRKDGSRFWAEAVLTALHDDHGSLRGFAKVTHDITERKNAELALQASERTLTRYTQELELRNKELEQFTYVASHDLAEPLRMVSNFCGLLKRRYLGRLDADADEFIGYAVDGAARMQNLLQDLLALSRVDSKRKPFQPTNCEDILAQTLVNLRLLIEQHGAVVTHDPLPTLPADETQLSQVFQNLIGNAVKFHGEKPPEIHIAAVRQGEEYMFTVRDQGIGFDPKQASRIFVIFQRLHTKAEYPGTGIGLSICKKVVERHGGRIWAESTPGAGSRFFFTIPVRQDSEDMNHARTAA